MKKKVLISELFFSQTNRDAEIVIETKPDFFRVFSGQWFVVWYSGGCWNLDTV